MSLRIVLQFFPFVFFEILFLKYVSVYVWSVHMYAYALKARRGIRSPGSGAEVGFVLPGMGSRSQTWVFCKSTARS